LSGRQQKPTACRLFFLLIGMRSAQAEASRVAPAAHPHRL